MFPSIFKRLLVLCKYFVTTAYCMSNFWSCHILLRKTVCLAMCALSAVICLTLLRKLNDCLIDSLGRPCTVVTGGLLKCSWCFFFFFISPRVLRGLSADRPETWPHGRKLSAFYNPSPKIRGGPSPQKNLGPKTCKISVDFIQPPTDREYLRNGSRYLKSESSKMHFFGQIYFSH